MKLPGPGKISETFSAVAGRVAVAPPSAAPAAGAVAAAAVGALGGVAAAPHAARRRAVSSSARVVAVREEGVRVGMAGSFPSMPRVVYLTPRRAMSLLGLRAMPDRAIRCRCR